jgi:hypothetical protein
MLTTALSPLELFQLCCNVPKPMQSSEIENDRRKCMEEVGTQFGFRGKRPKYSK